MGALTEITGSGARNRLASEAPRIAVATPQEAAVADVYRARLPGGKEAFVVLVTGPLGNGWPFAEAHLLSPGHSPPFRARRYAVGRPDSQAALALMPLIDPVAAAKDWAVGELEGDLLDWHRQQ